MNKEAIIYCRCSTKKQAFGHSLQRQLETCLKWARVNDYIPISVFSEIKSGYTGLLKIRDEACDIAAKKGIPVVVEHWDRFTRGTLPDNLPEIISVYDEIWAENKTLDEWDKNNAEQLTKTQK